MKEFRKWFDVFLNKLKESEYGDQIKAEEVYGYRHRLQGMLMFLRGKEEISEEEFESMLKEIGEAFDTVNLYGFHSLITTEVWRC